MKQALKALELAYTPLAKDRQEVLRAVKALHVAIAESSTYGGQHNKTETCQTWVGLTAKDLTEIPPSAFEGAIWAEGKLRQKNQIYDLDFADGAAVKRKSREFELAECYRCGWDSGAAAEREKCAEICDQEARRAEEWSKGLEVLSADRCAVAIRKRGTNAP